MTIFNTYTQQPARLPVAVPKSLILTPPPPPPPISIAIRAVNEHPNH